MAARGEIYVLTSNWRNCTQRFFLVDDEYTFGAKDCDINITRFGVADHHAKLVIDESGTATLFNLCRENPTLINGIELRRSCVLFDRDQFAIGYRTFVYRDAHYASERTDPRPFGPVSTKNRLATASDVVFSKQLLEHSAQACRNPGCCTLAQDNIILRKRVKHLQKKLQQNASGGLPKKRGRKVEENEIYGEGGDYDSIGDDDDDDENDNESESESEEGAKISDNEYLSDLAEDEDDTTEKKKEEATQEKKEAESTPRMQPTLSSPFGIGTEQLLALLGSVPLGMRKSETATDEEKKKEQSNPPAQSQDSQPPPPPPPPGDGEQYPPPGPAVPSRAFVPSPAFIERLESLSKTARSEIEQQRRRTNIRLYRSRFTAPLRDSSLTMFRSAVFERAMATSNFLFSAYVYRDLSGGPDYRPMPPRRLSSPPMQPPYPPAQPPPPPPPPGATPYYGRYEERGPRRPPFRPQYPPPPQPFRTNQITAEHFDIGVPLPRNDYRTRLIDCKDFILSTCSNPQCPYRHSPEAKHCWMVKQGSGACFNWLRGMCSDEKCRFIHFPPSRASSQTSYPPPPPPPYSSSQP